MTVLIVITVVALIVALVMSLVAWRLATDERRRSDARVATLASEIHQDLELRGSEPVPAPAMSAELFTAAQPTPSVTRLATVLAFVVIVVGSAATVGLLLGNESNRPTSAPGTDGRPSLEHSVANTPPGAPSPLELVALGHERDGDRLTVRGVVRNPASGTAVDGLTAVVFLFGTDGGFITSGRTTIESPRLGPGNESRFVVTVPAGADVGRYRVSFRTDDQIVPHVDRREPPLARK